MTDVTTKTSWESLAVLRFFLASIVLAGHTTWLSSQKICLADALDMFGGKAAVVGFLLVSGYSIGSSLERNHRQFYRRRLLRIYPLYFFAIVYTIGIELGTGGHVDLPGDSFHSLGWKTALGNLLLVQTFLVKPIAFDGPVWSLSVEVFYYLLAPLFARFPHRYLVGLTAASAVCSALPPRPEWGLAYLVLSKLNAARYLWCWLLGFMLWRVQSAKAPDDPGATPTTPSVQTQRRISVMLLLVVGAALVLFGRDTYEPLCILTYVTSVGVILGASRLTMPRRLCKAADYLGDLSYPLYLYHLPTFILGYAVLGLRVPLLLVGCAFLVTLVAFHFVDGFLKRRFFAPWVLGRPRRPRAEAPLVGS